MALTHLELDAITEADLQRLVTDREEERKTIDYKVALPAKSEGAKKEFLADIVSFANASGGDLIYGIRDEGSVAVEVYGLRGIDADAEIRAMEDSALKDIAPRIPGLASRAVALASGAHVLIVRVPSSWAAPHLVSFQESSRFCARTSKGKYLMDVSEIRAAFAASETLTERVHRFRIERLAAIRADTTPVILGAQARIVLHIVPFSALRPGNRVDLAMHGQHLHRMAYPLTSPDDRWVTRFNFDGFLAVCEDGEGRAYSYAQLFHDGSIETVETLLLQLGASHSPQQPLLHGKDLAQLLIPGVARYVSVLRLVGCQPPVLVMISLLGVNGYCLAGTLGSIMLRAPSVGIDRADLVLPEIMIEKLGEPTAPALQPAFDAIWNACGFPNAPAFDEQGNPPTR